MLQDYLKTLRTGKMPPIKQAVKKGTLAIGVVESTPVVWQGHLLRFEWVRNSGWGDYHGKPRSVGCYHFVDMATEMTMPEFAADHSFGCCVCADGKMYVHGVRGPGGGQALDTFVSDDLIHWQQSTALEFPPDVKLYNTSVCRGPDGWYMAIEIGGENRMVGRPFTCVFAKSDDLLHWELLPTDRCVYARDRYTACPVLRYVDGYYYMIYLEGAPCHRWVPYIVRTRDFADYELGLRNPVLTFGDEDRQLVHPERFSEAEREQIRCAVNCNNSDVDLCDYEGRTVILYSWGNQLGSEFLALAEYDGSVAEYLQSFFA